jgi:hypothetical protein
VDVDAVLVLHAQRLRLDDHGPHRVAPFEHLSGAGALSLGDRHFGGSVARSSAISSWLSGLTRTATTVRGQENTNRPDLA